MVSMASRALALPLALALACGGGGSSGEPDDAGPNDATPMVDARPDAAPDAEAPLTGELLSGGLTIRGIAAFQSVKVTLVDDGVVLPDTVLPMFAGKTTLFRVYVDIDDPLSWGGGRQVEARLDVLQGGEVFRQSTTTLNVRTNGSDESEGSTFDFRVNGIAIGADTTLRVVLLDPGSGLDETEVASSPSRFPADGSAFPLVVLDPPSLEITVVPFTFDERTPRVADEDQVQMRTLFEATYPVAVRGVTVTVREPVDYEGETFNFGDMLSQLGRLRAEDRPRDEAYYYGVIQPAETFGEFCSGGCVTGLGSVAGPTNVSRRTSVGVYFNREGDRFTMVHELGHNMGRRHSPCGGAAGAYRWPDEYPRSLAFFADLSDEEVERYREGRVGVYGYDARRDRVTNPDQRDFMSYCGNDWISDFTYLAIHERLQIVNGRMPMNGWLLGGKATHHVFRVQGDAPALYEGTVLDNRLRPEMALPATGGALVEAMDGLGRSLGYVAAHYVGRDHDDALSHELLVPEVEGAAAFRWGRATYRLPSVSTPER